MKITLTLTNFKNKMAQKALKNGIYENFGQKEIKELKKKYGYNPFGTKQEKELVEEIDYLNSWCMNFDQNILKLYKK